MKDDLFSALTVLDVVIAFIPVILGALAVYVSFRPPRPQHHWGWVSVFVTLGLAASLSALWQTAIGRVDANNERAVANRERTALTEKITHLETELKAAHDDVSHMNSIMSAQEQRRITEESKKPDLALMLMYAKSVALAVKNVSERVVNSPRYQAALWNLDARDELMQPLPIPVSTGAYIRPREQWGPILMMSVPAVQNRIRDGDRIFGIITVRCPDCVATRTYISYFQHGMGGWYAEGIPKQAAGIGITELIKLLSKDSTPLLNWIPEKRRMPIR